MIGGFYETVDHLVNNAGVARLRSFEKLTQFSDMDSVMVIKLHLCSNTNHLSYFWNNLVTLSVND